MTSTDPNLTDSGFPDGGLLDPRPTDPYPPKCLPALPLRLFVRKGLGKEGAPVSLVTAALIYNARQGPYGPVCARLARRLPVDPEAEAPPFPACLLAWGDLYGRLHERRDGGGAAPIGVLWWRLIDGESQAAWQTSRADIERYGRSEETAQGVKFHLPMRFFHRLDIDAFHEYKDVDQYGGAESVVAQDLGSAPGAFGQVPSPRFRTLAEHLAML